MSLWRCADVWQSVASELRGLRRAGLTGVMTEDTVRFATARALVEAGCDPAGLRVEYPHPVLAGSRIDLAVGQPVSAFIEFKFPREPNEKNAAWTMVLGEVLKDFYRLASCPGDLDRVFVYLESARLRLYMAKSAARYGHRLDTEHVAFDPADAARLPATAADAIGRTLAARKITARRLHVLTVDATLQLAVYVVDSLNEATPHPADLAPRQVDALQAEATRTAPAGTTAAKQGARQEILDAVDALLLRSGGNTFAVGDVINELRRRGSRYAESTIRTMVTSHMCANAPDHAAVTYNDFERIDRATYRRR